MELEQSREKLAKRGYGIAAISYDSADALKHFASRRGIRFALLSDPESKIIRSFGIFNTSVPPGNPSYGIPHPGMFWVNADGIVIARDFEDDFRERYIVSGILTTRFGESDARAVAETEHLSITASLRPEAVIVGQRAAVELNVEMKSGIHVYAPGVQEDYIPVRWDMAESPAWKAHAPTFPQSERMRLAGDVVPVFHGKLRLMRDVTIAPDLKVVQAAAGSNGELIIKGSFRYQACDETKCFPPLTVPLEWKVHVEALDRERVPVEIRRRP